MEPQVFTNMIWFKEIYYSKFLATEHLPEMSVLPGLGPGDRPERGEHPAVCGVHKPKCLSRG